jgi:PAS domain S-box-containing protein
MRKPRWILTSSITAGFALALLFLLTAGGLIYRGQVQMAELNADIDRTLALLDQTGVVFALLVDAEAGQRGYSWTGAERLLKPYEAATAALPGESAVLHDLCAGNPDAQRRLAHLDVLIKTRLDGLRGMIDLRRHQGADAAPPMDAVDADAATMDGIRVEIQALRSAERADLLLRGEIRQTRRLRNRVATSAAIFSGALLAALTLLALNQQTRRRVVAEEERDRSLRAEVALEERARVAEVLRASEEELRALFTFSPLGKCQADPITGRFLRVNPRLCEITGYTEAELLEMTFPELVAPEDQEPSMARVRSAMEGGAGGHAREIHAIRKDGTRIWLQVDITFLKDAEGRVVRTISTVRDVTAHRAAEAEREELLRIATQARADAEQARMRAQRLVDANIMGVCVGRGTVITEANDAFLGIVGYTRADLETGPLPWREMTPPEHGALDECALVELAERGASTPYEKSFVRKDGTLVPILLGAATLGDPHAEEWVCFIVDLTDRNRSVAELRAARAQAEAANRAKDEFLSVLSHELRTPLHAVFGWLSILKIGLARGNDVSRAIETLERNAALQAQLVNDLLDVSRIVAGNLVLAEEPVELTAVVHAVVESARPAAAAKGVALACEIEPSSCVVRGEQVRLSQALGNLLNNAVKFTPSGGEISVTLASDTDEATIRIRDTGIGIAPEFLAHVFDRFRQADATNTRAHGGLGIGLYLVKTLVELHRGGVDVSSEGGGKGTTFTVRLPLQAVAEAPRAAATPPREQRSRQLAGVTVVLVDDEHDCRETIGVLLRSRGAAVHTCESAEDARRALDRVRPDVIVSDIGMPGENGYAFIRSVRARDEDRIPAIALTGFASRQDAEEAMRAGFDEHLAKPVHIEVLVAKLRDMVGLVRGASAAPDQGALRG